MARVHRRASRGGRWFEFTVELREAGGGTEVVYSGNTESMKGFFGKLADPLVAKMHERDMKSNLENLTSLLEDEPS